jgi:hypothetical protein
MKQHKLLYENIQLHGTIQTYYFIGLMENLALYNGDKNGTTMTHKTLDKALNKRKNILMEAYMREAEVEGLEKTIIDACYDRIFCKINNIDYNSIHLYKEISELMKRYKHVD